MEYKWCFLVVNCLNFVVTLNQAMRIKTKTDLIPEETKRLKRDVDNEEQNDFDDFNRNYNNDLTWNDVRWAELNTPEGNFFNQSALDELSQNLTNSLSADVVNHLNNQQIPSVDVVKVLNDQESSHYRRFYHVMTPIFIIVLILKICFFIFRRRGQSVVLVRSCQIPRNNQTSQSNQSNVSTSPPQRDDPPSYEEAVVDIPQNIRLTQNSDK